MSHRIWRGAAIGFLTAGLIGCCSSRGPKTDDGGRGTRAGHTPSPCDGLPHDYVVKVPVSHACENVVVSKDERNIVQWFGDKHHDLDIVFPGATNPFEFLKCNGHVCVGFVITTDNAKLPLTLKYEVHIDGHMVQDPNIIIKP